MSMFKLMTGNGENQNSIWNRVIEVANTDNKITSEESILIKTVLESAKNYEKMLDKALEDNEIDNREMLALIKKRQDILDQAYGDVSADEEISDDEYEIIKEVMKILHKLELEEEQFFTGDL